MGFENFVSIDVLNVVITVQHVIVFVSGLAISLSLCVGSVFSPALCMTFISCDTGSQVIQSLPLWRR